MAYSELIKDVSRIRNYMREFFVYGFKSREEIGMKSARSYDNEKRRIESWLADYMSFRQDAKGKAVFFSVDSRHIPHNPLYKAWKTASFTKNDISLHFTLLDILADGIPRSLSDLVNNINDDYMSCFVAAEPIDESTLRKKLKEYADIGLLETEKCGKQYLYSLSCDDTNLDAWREAIAFFSEGNPLGVVGSFLLDKYNDPQLDIFTFKHRYLLFALDNGIMLDLLAAIHSHQKAELEVAGGKTGGVKHVVIIPLKIYISTQGGRQYLVAYSLWKKRISFFRLDSIIKVKPMETLQNWDTYKELLQNERPYIWGVSCGQYRLEHIELTLRVGSNDTHIIQRLIRERRCGLVKQLSENDWQFTADVYDAWELMPWLRTFTGRIVSLVSSNKKVEDQFWSDYAAISDMYGGGNDVI